jgi:glycosyltransferase involved in cell wall biosynthesis
MLVSDAEKIVLVTSTRYRSDSLSDTIRSELALSLVKQAKELNYSVIIVDDNSPEPLIKEFQTNNAQVYQQERKGMGNARRQAFSLAYDSGKEVIVWLEPEKDSFVRHIGKCAKPILKGNAGVVIPRRKSLDSYPEFQRISETEGNNFFKEITQASFDVFFGPRLFQRKLSHYFINYDGRYGDLWESINIPIVEMVFKKERIREIIVDFEYPSQQAQLESQSQEFLEKRKIQLAQTKECLEKHWRFLNALYSK